MSHPLLKLEGKTIKFITVYNDETIHITTEDELHFSIKYTSAIFVGDSKEEITDREDFDSYGTLKLGK